MSAHATRRWLLAGLLGAAFLGCETVGDVLSPRDDAGATASAGLSNAMGGASGGIANGGIANGGIANGGATGGSAAGTSTGGTAEAGAASTGGNAGLDYSGSPADLALGDNHTCFIDQGALYCFGDGGDGSLGNGTLDNRTRPTRSGMAADYVGVALGAHATCALRTAGEVECAGSGESGQLGNGDFKDSAVFVPVTLPGPALSLRAGHGHFCAILEDRKLFCWGANAEGQLGQPDPFPAPGPPSATPLEVAPGWRFTHVGPGQGHTCAIRDDGSLYCWGRNTSNELGLGDAADDQLRTPQLVSSATDWVDVRGGQNSTCGLRAGGRVDCWGDNSSGQFGTGDRTMRDRPTTIQADGVQDLDLNTFHACLLRTDGVACAGRAIEGALGNGTSGAAAASQVMFTVAAGTEQSLTVRVGRFHTCIASATQIKCAGQNDDGRLGTGDREERSLFTPIRAPEVP